MAADTKSASSLRSLPQLVRFFVQMLVLELLSAVKNNKIVTHCRNLFDRSQFLVVIIQFLPVICVCPSARLSNFAVWFSIYFSLLVISDEGRNFETGRLKSYLVCYLCFCINLLLFKQRCCSKNLAHLWLK